MYQGAYVYKQIDLINLAKNSFVEDAEKPGDHTEFIEESIKNQI